jgi:hypothetical protein
MMDRDISSRIRNILREVQGDLFFDAFQKDDERIATIMGQIARLEKEIIGLQKEIIDWKTRSYKPNSNTIKDSRGQIVSIGQLNERRRRNEIAERKLKIKNIEEQILVLKLEIRM